MSQGISQTFITGRVGNTPEVSVIINKSTNEQISVTSLNIAVNNSWRDGDEKKSKTTWHNVKAFGGKADVISKYVKKGDMITVVAEYNVREYTAKDNSTKYAHEFILREVVLIGATAKKEKEDENNTSESFDNDENVMPTTE